MILKTYGIDTKQKWNNLETYQLSDLGSAINVIPYQIYEEIINDIALA